MGVADLHDSRTWTVSPAEWVQHILRLSTGQFVDSRREHRVIWAMVNTVLLSEAAGKGFAVHRSIMKRQGHRLVGGSVLTRSELRAMIENEESIRAMVNQVMVVGRDVRSTPMQMGYEGKKLTCAVKHLSWKPPWVQDMDGELDEAAGYLGENSVVPDLVGLGRFPGIW